MTTVQNISISAIDPKSTINVRRQGVEENVEKVKTSIQAHGYWPDMPIVVRPHPISESEYDYEHVTGQCRFKACSELGMEEIPAFVFDLSDDEAIQRSWLENEARGDLTYSDRAYWTERIYKKYAGAGYTSGEALEKAAEYLGVGTETVKRYWTLVGLPEDLKEMVDQGMLSNGHAVAIVRNTYDGAWLEQSQEKMRERASWLLGLERDSREHAVKALEDLGHSANIAELNKYVGERADENKRTVQYAIPQELHESLLEWGKTRGLEDTTTIVSHMITDVLRRTG